MSWQKILAQGFTSAKELLEFLELPVALGGAQAELQFKTRVPRRFAARMQHKNSQDPLLLQVLATQEELQTVPHFVLDPLEENKKNFLQGLIHKYQGRVLLTLTGVCAIHCRYCFRRHFPYQENNPGRHGWQQVLDYIRCDTSIHEVILSGGDPFLASDLVLSDLLQALETIPQIRTVRFHTRIPIVLPERVDDALLNLLSHSRLRKVIVLHCNHAQEIDDNVQEACNLLRRHNCTLLNQSVLLKGVNDDVTVLAELSERLFSCGVLPYYLHLLDKVVGTAHFDVPEATALRLYRRLQKQLPGYLIPRLAREEPGKDSKTIFV